MKTILFAGLSPKETYLKDGWVEKFVGFTNYNYAHQLREIAGQWDIIFDVTEYRSGHWKGSFLVSPVGCQRIINWLAEQA